MLGQLIKSLEEIVRNLYQARISNYILLLIAEKTTTLDLTFFENPEFYEILTNASNESSHRPILIVSQLIAAISSLVTLVTLTTTLLLWQAWIVPILFITSLLTFWFSIHFGTAYVNLVVKRTSMQRKAEYINLILTGDWAAKDIRLFNLGSFLITRLRSVLNTIYHQDYKFAKRKIIYSSIVQIGTSIIKPILVGFTAFQAVRQIISIGQFNLYIQSILQVEDSLTQLMITLAGLHENNLFVSNLFRFLALESEVEKIRSNITTNKFQPDSDLFVPCIEFRNVSFRYHDSDKFVISNLSFKIHPGEKVALVGKNGSGKTTIVKLLAGLYQPSEGQILLDNIDIKELDRKVLRRYLSLIFQDYYIYHFSVRDNIGIGSIDQIHNYSRIKDAARRSGIASVIEKLPDTYDTVLGRFFEFGHELSGGQRQLIALARALIRNAPILILDEPAAALDVYAEQNFFKLLFEGNSVRNNQTVIFISHRFTTVHRADRIFVMENGDLSEQGSHAQLMKLQGHYAEMFRLQTRMYDKGSVTTAGKS